MDSFARGYCDHCKFAVTVATPGGKQQLKMHTAKHDKTIGRCSQHRRLLSSPLTDSHLSHIMLVSRNNISTIILSSSSRTTMLMALLAAAVLVSLSDALTTIPRTSPFIGIRVQLSFGRRSFPSPIHQSLSNRIVSNQHNSHHGSQTSPTTTSSSPTALQAFSTALSEISTFYESFPFASACITCGIKASAADIVAQQAEAVQERVGDVYDEDEEKEHSVAFLVMQQQQHDSSSFNIKIHLDTTTTKTNSDGLLQIEARRNFSFIIYGGLYQGIAQHIIFNELFPLIFGEGTTVASKVLFDSLCISPFICLPVAYLVKSVVFQFTVQEAFERYKQDIFENGLLFKYWSLWVPAQCFTFGVVSQHLRIAFIASVSFFWLIVFSSVSSQEN